MAGSYRQRSGKHAFAFNYRVFFCVTLKKLPKVICKKEELVGQNNIVDMRARGLTNGNVDQADTRESTLELLVPCQLALFYPHTHTRQRQRQRQIVYTSLSLCLA